jgi:SET domain-containing protein
MLLVETKAHKSPLQGMGCFAGEFIPKGAVIWKFSSTVDGAYTQKEVEQLSEPKRSEILSLYHAYISTQTNRYIDPGDNAKYINHSTNANVGTRFEKEIEEDINFALRDIQKGEEITIDYRTFAKEGVDFKAS